MAFQENTQILITQSNLVRDRDFSTASSLPVIGRHAHADQYKAVDFVVPGAGQLTLSFKGADGLDITRVINDFKGPGVALGMFNTDESIRFEGFDNLVGKGGETCWPKGACF